MIDNKLLIRWFAIVAIVTAASFILDSALFTVNPGQVGAIVQQGQVTRVISDSGLHWKSPNTQVALLDARNQIATVDFRADKTDSASTSRGARYAVVWKLADPKAFYAATHNNDPEADVQGKLGDAADPALRKRLAKPGAKQVFAVSSASVMSAFEAAIKPAAQKLGIQVQSVSLVRLNLSQTAQKALADAMLAADRKQRQATVSAHHEHIEQQIEKTRAQAAGILSDAHQQAARIRGESEAKIAGIYAKAAKPAPRFFDFYQTLMSEQAALKKQTKLFIVSSDSPWFKLLGESSSTQDTPH